jgi:hypothetical protein
VRDVRHPMWLMTARRGWLHKHSLTITSGAILSLWITLYSRSNPDTHLGAFFGNAVADWTGLLVTVLATKYLYERGSAESKRPRGILPKKWEEFLRDHSLTIFLLLTGGLWVAAYIRMDAQGRWGQVVGNIVSEWTQVLGIVLMTKRLVERGSKESK